MYTFIYFYHHDLRINSCLSLQHMLQFQMTVWLPPLSKNFLTNITPSNHVSLADFAEKAVSQPGHKTSAYIVNFKYEVNYHITSNGICSPVGFKISPGSYTDEAKKYLQMIINDSLHYEAQLLDLPNTIHEPADRSKDVCKDCFLFFPFISRTINF